MRPRIFLRTREFFWQEGHNVFATAEEANADARKMHEVYTRYMSEVLAINSITGEKTPEERFAGADHTYTREMIMQDGKAVQMGTSHDLGRHFSKSFGIKFLGADGKLQYAYTTSWGTTSRMIGCVIMTHGDDDGLRLPPAIAPYQIVVIPIMAGQNKFAHEVAARLRASGIRVLVDDSDARSPDKIWKWIRRGAPLRVEIGAREAESATATITRRDIGKESKRVVSVDELVASAPAILDEIQSGMLAESESRNKSMVAEAADLDALERHLKSGKTGFVRLPYKETQSPKFESLMEEYKISRRCLDDNDPSFVFVAKSY
jgi:prolyl-tRNA synthetase